jgi:hypothetical protein
MVAAQIVLAFQSVLSQVHINMDATVHNTPTDVASKHQLCIDAWAKLVPLHIVRWEG